MARVDKRAELVGSYIRGSGLTPLIVGSSSAGDASKLVIDDCDDAEFFTAFWFRGRAHCELVKISCERSVVFHDTSWIALPAPKLSALVITTADAISATWRAADDVAAEATAAVDDLERQVEAWKQAGGLAPMNAAYKQHRQLCLATTQPAISYSDHLHGFKLKVVELVASNVARGLDRFSGVQQLKPDPLPTIRRRDHFREGEYADPWLTGTIKPLPGWSPRARALPREW